MKCTTNFINCNLEVLDMAGDGVGVGEGWGLHLSLTKCFGSKYQFKSLTYIISFIIVQFGTLNCEKVL